MKLLLLALQLFSFRIASMSFTRLETDLKLTQISYHVYVVIKQTKLACQGSYKQALAAMHVVQLLLAKCLFAYELDYGLFSNKNGMVFTKFLTVIILGRWCSITTLIRGLSDICSKRHLCKRPLCEVGLLYWQPILT